MRVFEADVPEAVLAALPDKKKRIYYLELLWPAAAVYVWCERLAGTYPIVYDDNEGAKCNLLKAFSRDFASSLFARTILGSFIGSEISPVDCESGVHG